MQTVLFFFAPIGLSLLAASLSPTNLRCEYKTNPLGIDILQPRLSWQLESDKRAVRQSAYQIQVALSSEALAKENALLWDSGKVDSEQSIQVVYAGPQLQTAQRYFWRVRVWDGNDKVSGWSDIQFWEMSLLAADDWQVAWIQPDLVEDKDLSNPAPMLRTEFQLTKDIKQARLYITALGLYEAEINGKRVGDELFTPGWTSYDTRLQYQTYDVTDQLLNGDNAIGVNLGDGWYRGRLAWDKNRNIYGEKLALLAQLQVEYTDGSRQMIGSDGSWKATTGPILFSDIYDGEKYDARLEKQGWTKSGFDDKDWSGVTVIERDNSILIAPQGPPVRRTVEIKPIEILHTTAGETVFDMGQNMVGWLKLQVQGPAGTTVTLRHAEVLDKDGNFYIENLRKAKQTVEYTLKGDGVEIYEPHFTFQGFRYVAVEGFPGTPTLEALTGIVIHSDMTPTGTFSCSDSMLNQLQHNIQWGQRGNFLDVPTDCPQRDERLGWTGDAEVFARTACYNMDAASFFTKWMKDVAADQKKSGAVPHVIPNVLSHGKESGASGSAGWADVAVIIPWNIYEIYGDTRILEQQYPSMKAWVEYQRSQAGDSYLWTQDFTFGDWLAFATNRSDYPGATTDKDLVSSAFFAYATSLMQRTAEVLGKTDDACDYAALFAKIKEAFGKEFITPKGRLASNTQTAYTLALAFDLFPDSLKEQAAARLAENVRSFKHITTGFLGTPLISHVLSDNGYYDEVFMLLTRKDYPSWLYPITMGATTIWERWDGIKPDGSFQSKGMNSFNHYAYGAIGDWMYKQIAGINPDISAPGYKHILITPHRGGGLTQASATFKSMYGMIESGWEWKNGTMNVYVTIPANTTATVVLPGAKLADVKEGKSKVAKAKGIASAQDVSGGIKLQVGSGNYNFSFPMESSIE
ncbi:MAG: family 78 glycoside hydrolase catalytic domain [Deferribacteres bacterium]|nr:glycoside hydrolase family 78 protein [candidate division KSB1 bacterium]MCB9502758.1 family 78 glycoside hydrolase catalytic domain [Deferribacteres bacterium]